MTTWKRFGSLKVGYDGTIQGPAGSDLVQHLDGKLEPYITRNARRVHVRDLVAHAWLPKPEPDQTMVIHKDRNTRNNYASNLVWATRDEYAHHWGSASGPLVAKAAGKFAAMPDEFYEYVLRHASKGPRRILELLEGTEWHSHNFSQYYIRRILKGQVRRDLFLKYRQKRENRVNAIVRDRYKRNLLGKLEPLQEAPKA